MWGRGEAYTGFWWGNLKERDHVRDTRIDRRIILRWNFRKWNVGVRTAKNGKDLIWKRSPRVYKQGVLEMHQH